MDCFRKFGQVSCRFLSFLWTSSKVLDQLPKKHERIEFCELDGRQLELYGSLVAECAEAVKKNDTGGFSNNDARCFLMQLRKAANHPLLLRRLYDDEKLKKMANCLCKVSRNGKFSVSFSAQFCFFRKKVIATLIQNWSSKICKWWATSNYRKCVTIIRREKYIRNTNLPFFLYNTNF